DDITYVRDLETVHEAAPDVGQACTNSRMRLGRTHFPGRNLDARRVHWLRHRRQRLRPRAWLVSRARRPHRARGGKDRRVEESGGAPGYFVRLGLMTCKTQVIIYDDHTIMQPLRKRCRYTGGNLVRGRARDTRRAWQYLRFDHGLSAV